MQSQHQNPFNITIKWQNGECEIKDLNSEVKIMELKVRIYEETGIQRDRQVLKILTTDFILGKSINDDEETLGDVGIVNGTQLVVVCTNEVGGDTQFPEMDGLLKDYEIIGAEEIFEAEITKPAFNIKILNPLRENKKLLIMSGVRGTLFHEGRFNEKVLQINHMRPFLHEFLTRVYRHYDIVIWKTSKSLDMDKSLNNAGVLDNPNYKIAACLDNKYMIPLYSSKYGVFKTKSLEIIWKNYPQYSAKNTIIVDCKKFNIMLNPLAGLIVKTYCDWYSSDKDAELVNLANYLELMANVEDFQMLNHRKWRDSITEVNIPPKYGRISKEQASEKTEEEDIEQIPVSAVVNTTYYLSEVQKTINRYKIERLNPRRKEKNLLILNFEYVLFDPNCQPQTDRKAVRPFLKKFLSKIYQMYDIAIWSGGRMEWVKDKLKSLGILDSKKFRINFILDYSAETTLVTPQYGKINVRALDVIYKTYSGYRKKSPVIIDTDVRNFMLHPRSVVTVKPYPDPEVQWEDDRTLQRLYEYLSYTCGSVIDRRHDWENYKETQMKNWQKRRVEDCERDIGTSENNLKSDIQRKEEYEAKLKSPWVPEEPNWAHDDEGDDIEVEQKIPFEEEGAEANELYLQAIQKIIQTYKIKEVTPLRKDKKLLVISMISRAERDSYRFYIHEFLTRVNRYYNVVIWCGDDEWAVASGMESLDIKRNPNYEISFYLTLPAVLKLYQLQNRKEIHVKPLEIIWQNYPQYSAQNTVIIGSSKKLFVMNPQSALICETFSREKSNREEDKVLGKLADYLETIAGIDDFETLDHSRWQQCNIVNKN